MLHNWENSNKILAGTGHRPSKLGEEYQLDGPISAYLRKQLYKLFEELHPRQIISGMALGFDQLLAQCALEHKIPVLAAIPCDNQEKVWPATSQKLYRSILEHPLVTQYVVAPGAYHASVMQLRNIWMCDHANALVAAWDGTRGGTANCIKYARTISLPIIYLDLLTSTQQSEQNILF